MESKNLNNAETVVKDKNLTEELKNSQPTPFVGIWKGIYNGRLIKIILETTTQSKIPVGWYYWCDLGNREENKKIMISLIDYDEKEGLILIESDGNLGATNYINMRAWVNSSSCNNMIIGVSKEFASVMLMKTNV
jgi:hypothetical protein